MVNESGTTINLFDQNQKRNCNSIALRQSQEKKGKTMKKPVSILMASLVALSMSFHSANAGLLGMPLNLRVAIELIEVDALAPSCQFYTDDVLTGPLLVKGC
jgi:hypothetical protein